jgi:hypothetical protein
MCVSLTLTLELVQPLQHCARLDHLEATELVWGEGE